MSREVLGACFSTAGPCEDPREHEKAPWARSVARVQGASNVGFVVVVAVPTAEVHAVCFLEILDMTCELGPFPVDINRPAPPSTQSAGYR